MDSKRWIWKETAETIGVLGIIATLIFVAFEMRQNTDAVRSATIQDMSRWSFDGAALAIEYPEIIAARRAGCEGTLTEAQRDLMLHYYNALLRIHLNRFFQTQLGIVDEETALAIGGRGSAYVNPLFPELWLQLKAQFPPEFHEFIERAILPLSQETPTICW